jgi:hypothetical protein
MNWQINFLEGPSLGPVYDGLTVVSPASFMNHTCGLQAHATLCRAKALSILDYPTTPCSR